MVHSALNVKPYILHMFHNTNLMFCGTQITQQFEQMIENKDILIPLLNVLLVWSDESVSLGNSQLTHIYLKAHSYL